MQCAWPFKQLNTPNDLWLSSAVCEVSHFIFLMRFFWKKFIFAQEVYLHQWTLDLWVQQNLHGTLLSFCTMQQCSWGLKQMALCEGYVCCNMFAMFIRCQSNLLTEMRARERKWGRLFFVFSCACVHITLCLQILNSSECRTYLSDVKGNKCNFKVELFQLYHPTPLRTHIHTL